MNKPPPFLLGGALLFWGWQTEFMLPAVLMALVLESPHIIKARWDFAEEDFTRIWTFCALLLIAAAIYAFSASEAPTELANLFQNPTLSNQRRITATSSRAIAALIRWQPMIFFPFMAAQAFSAREGVPLQTISLILQRRWKRAQKLGRKLPPSPTVHVGYAYLVLCIFSASIHPSETTEFFWGLAVLLGWALWPQRSRRFALPVWAVVLVAAVGMGYGAQLAIRELQTYIGSLNPRWFAHSSRRGYDPFKNRTSLGHVGRLKQSGQITIRLETKEGGRVPPLLREASYRNYRVQGQSWSSGNSRLDFDQVKDTNVNSYVLVPGEFVTTPLKIACYLPGGQGLLPLPEGTARLDNLPVFGLSKNKCGAVLADGPGLVIFDALHGPGISFDSPPDEQLDLGVPTNEVPALDAVISELGLKDQPLPLVTRVLGSWFATNFTYSTWEEAPSVGERRNSPLTRFLLKTRSGHCEYFATATVLVLRRLGFPARYAVGYAAHENVGGNKYVARQRDAHSWCLVWRDGLWRDLDTTPGSWIAREAQRASPLQRLSDFWSRLVFEFSKIRYGETHLRRYILWGLCVVLLLLLYQILFSRKRRRHHAGAAPARVPPSWPGLDSEFYSLEKALAARGLLRNPAEPLSAWLSRVAMDSGLSVLGPEFQALLALHYRYRFDPLGLTRTDRELLRACVNDCLSRLAVAARGSASPLVRGG